MFCRKCHYALEKLSERRCPECGTTFDPKDRASFRTKSELETRKGDGEFWAGVILSVVLIALVLGIWIWVRSS